MPLTASVCDLIVNKIWGGGGGGGGLRNNKLLSFSGATDPMGREGGGDQSGVMIITLHYNHASSLQYSRRECTSLQRTGLLLVSYPDPDSHSCGWIAMWKE